ncbi:uncharacterized [Tachysurus ichikawai]
MTTHSSDEQNGLCDDQISQGIWRIVQKPGPELQCPLTLTQAAEDSSLLASPRKSNMSGPDKPPSPMRPDWAALSQRLRHDRDRGFTRPALPCCTGSCRTGAHRLMRHRSC